MNSLHIFLLNSASIIYIYNPNKNSLINYSKLIMKVDDNPNIRKASTLSRRRHSQKVKNLPSTFFERLLILEMELETEFSLSTLNELISQYSVIII